MSKFCLIVVFVFIGTFTSYAKQKIIVGGDYNYPPYSFINEQGVEVGYDVDVIKAIANELDFEVEFKFDRWDTTLNRLDRAEIDAIASIVYSREREKRYDFTFPLHTEYYAIFSKKKSNINDVNDLGGKRPAFLQGDISNERFLEPMGLINDLVIVNSLPEAFHKINLDSCDYVIAPYPLGMKIIKDSKLKNIEVKGPPIIPSVYCLAVSQGESELLSKLNLGIEILSRNGELDKIYSKWVKYSREDEQYESWFHYTLYILFGLIVLVLLLVLFWYSLKKQVQKKTREIKHAQLIYHKVFNSVDDVLILFNKDGCVIDANARALEMYQLEYDQMIGVNYLDIISEGNKDLFKNLLNSLQSGSFTFRQNVKRINENGVKYYDAQGMNIMLDDEDKYLAVLHDITNEKTNFFNLEQAKNIAEKANKTKSTFLTIISHEIKTPLNAIVGYSNILSKANLNEKTSAFAAKIGLSAGHLLNLVNNIFDFTAIESEKLKIITESFNLINEIKDLCAYHEQNAIDCGIALVLDIPDNIPAFVEGDKKRLLQVLQNLLNNAIKFTPQGQVELRLQLAKSTDSIEKNIRFLVKDTGIGISKDVQTKLFEPFVHKQNNNQQHYGGAGLGMAITGHLVKLLNGQIRVKSKVGEGTLFEVDIPFKVINQTNEKKLASNDKEQAKAPMQEIKVLLVEDNAFNAEVLIEQMDDTNLIINWEESGEKALECLLKKQYDAILMDVEMPGMNGFETVKRIKEQNLSKAPIIGLSANTFQIHKKQAIDCGMNDYVNKPVVPEILYKAILNAVELDRHLVEGADKIIDFEAGLDFFNGDEKMYHKTLKRFIENYSFLISENNQELHEIKTAVHNIKSAARMIGANQLTTIAIDINTKIKNEIAAETASDFSKLKAELLKVIDEINGYV